MERDGETKESARELLRDARKEVLNGANPEEILEDYFGLEPDYIFDII
jgi:uncharacterized protein (DUF433 family)